MYRRDTLRFPISVLKHLQFLYKIGHLKVSQSLMY